MIVKEYNDTELIVRDYWSSSSKWSSKESFASFGRTRSPTSSSLGCLSPSSFSITPLLMDYIFFRNKNITIALPENKRLWNIRVMSTIIGGMETIPKISEMRLDEFKLIIQGRVGNSLIKVMLRFARVLWKVLEETLCHLIFSNHTPGVNIPMHKQQLQWYKICVMGLTTKTVIGHVVEPSIKIVN